LKIKNVPLKQKKRSTKTKYFVGTKNKKHYWNFQEKKKENTRWAGGDVNHTVGRADQGERCRPRAWALCDGSARTRARFPEHWRSRLHWALLGSHCHPLWDFMLLGLNWPNKLAHILFRNNFIIVLAI